MVVYHPTLVGVREGASVFIVEIDSIYIAIAKQECLSV
jgi:hypothetical protein